MSTPDNKLSEPLQDIVEMVENRPDLSQAEWEIANKAIPWLRSKIKIDLRTEFEKEYDLKLAKALAEEVDKQKVANKAYIDESLAAMKKAQEPLGEEDIKKLLSQEYVEFETHLRVPVKDFTDENPTFEKRKFVISELPSSVEERFYKLLKESLVPILQERENISFSLNQGSLLEKIQKILEMSEKAFELGGKLVAICLDPWGKDPSINGKWVSTHLSSIRQAAIILAQFEANKYRDFFSQGFRTFLNLKQ